MSKKHRQDNHTHKAQRIYAIPKNHAAASMENTIQLMLEGSIRDELECLNKITKMTWQEAVLYYLFGNVRPADPNQGGKSYLL